MSIPHYAAASLRKNQIAAALQYLHDQGLVHRDIKPENLLLGAHDEVLLSDFGIAALSFTQQYHEQQRVTGTLPYMAPEQFRGEARSASDQYSLACLVYEWLCGTPPFSGANFEQFAFQHWQVPPPPVHTRLPTVLPDLEQAVLKALAKDPQQRFPRVQDFADALERACLPSAGESAYPEPVSQAIRECYLRSCEIPALLGDPQPINTEEIGPHTSRRGTTGYQRPFQNGSIYWSDPGGAHPVWWGIKACFHQLDELRGRLGFPVTDELIAYDAQPQQNPSKCQRFEFEFDYPEEVSSNVVGVPCGATIYWSERTGAYATWGGIGECFERLGGTVTQLGFPISPEQEAATSPRGTAGYYQTFEGGAIYWSERHLGR